MYRVHCVYKAMLSTKDSTSLLSFLAPLFSNTMQDWSDDQIILDEYMIGRHIGRAELFDGNMVSTSQIVCLDSPFNTKNERMNEGDQINIGDEL